MRHFVLFIVLVNIGAASQDGQPSQAAQSPSQTVPTILPPDQPATLVECLQQALLMNDPLQDWRYMGICALRFSKAERDAFESRINPNDPATPIRVGNIVRNGIGGANFLERQAKQSAQMPESLKPILGYWRVDKVDFRNRKYGSNFAAEKSAEAFTLFPHIATVVDRIEGFGICRKNTGECIVAVPTDAGSPSAWAEALYVIASHYGIRGRIVVSDAVLQTLAKGLRTPQVIRQQKGARTTWYLVEL